MSEKPDDKGDDSKVDQVKIDKIEDKIDTVADKIETTPDGEKDEKWRTELTSTLTTISQELADLKTQQGASPEIKELLEEIRKLSTAVRAIKSGEVDPSKKSEVGSAAGPASLETPKGTSLETAVPPKKDPPEPKPKPAVKTAHKRGNWL